MPIVFVVVQAGIQQIDKITPTPPMSFQTDSMMPLDLGAPAPSQVPAILTDPEIDQTNSTSRLWSHKLPNQSVPWL